MRELQQQAMLRIHGPRLHRREAEERGVEVAGRIEHGRRLHVAAVRQLRAAHPGLKNLLVRQARDRLDAVGQIAPELVESSCAGKPSRHADDGDVDDRSLIAPGWPPTFLGHDERGRRVQRLEILDVQIVDADLDRKGLFDERHQLDREQGVDDARLEEIVVIGKMRQVDRLRDEALDGALDFSSGFRRS